MCTPSRCRSSPTPDTRRSASGAHGLRSVRPGGSIGRREEMEKYTVRSNPMPSPLASAMGSLLDRDAHVLDAYPDNQGHHLVMNKGALHIHITLVLDWNADGVDWADGDLSWE